jgi:hypothetical protein
MADISRREEGNISDTELRLSRALAYLGYCLEGYVIMIGIGKHNG